MIHMLPNLLLAVIVLVIGFFFSHWLGRKSRKFIKTITKIDIIINLFGSLIYVVFLSITFLITLKTLNLDKALKEIQDRLSKQGVLFYYENFGDSSVDFFVRLWLKETNQVFYLETRSQAIMIIKKAVDDHNLNIPYPVRILDIGGEIKRN